MCGFADNSVAMMDTHPSYDILYIGYIYKIFTIFNILVYLCCNNFAIWSIF